MEILSPFFKRVTTTARRAMPILLSRRALLIAALFWIPVGAFLGLADEVKEGDTLPFDRGVLEWIHAHIYSQGLNPYVVSLTTIGGVLGTTVIVAGGLVLLLARGYRRSAAFVLAVVGGTELVNSILKAIFIRDRPSLFDRIVLENSFSFPSGHAMMSSALAFTVIVLAWRTRFRWPVTVVAVLYFLGVSFTRLYLGVHYPTDVIAGWCVSAAWVATMYYALQMDRRRVAPSLKRDDQSQHAAAAKQYTKE